MSWDYPTGKNVIRQELFQMMDSTEPAKNALMMPGKGCLCVKEALKHNRIDKDTHIYAIEKDWENAQTIKEELDKEGFTYNLLNVQLKDTMGLQLKMAVKDELRVKPWLTKEENETDVYKIKWDLVYLDTCGCLTDGIENSIRHFVIPRCKPTTQFAVTFMNSNRAQYGYETPPDWWMKDHDVSDKGPANRNAKNLSYAMFRMINPAYYERIYQCKWMRTYKNARHSAPMVTCLFVPNAKIEQDEALREWANICTEFEKARDRFNACGCSPNLTGSVNTRDLNYI